MKLDESSRGLALQKLLKDKLRDLFDWEMPNIIRTVGPYDPTIFHVFNDLRSSLVEKVRSHLASLTDEEIDALIEPKTQQDHETNERWYKYERNAILRLQKQNPPWYAGGFGHQACKADFEFWAQMPSYTNHEALMLSLGVEPEWIHEDFVKGLPQVLEKGTDLYPSLKYLLRRSQQIDRQFPMHAVGRKVTPIDFFAWAQKVRLDMHPDFHSHFVTQQDSPQASVMEIDDDRLDPRVRSSMLKLIATMAVGGYSYEPGKRYSNVVRDILDDASKLGINITDDTVRNYLKLSEKMISADWKADDSYSDSD